MSAFTASMYPLSTTVINAVTPMRSLASTLALCVPASAFMVSVWPMVATNINTVTARRAIHSLYISAGSDMIYGDRGKEGMHVGVLFAAVMGGWLLAQRSQCSPPVRGDRTDSGATETVYRRVGGPQATMATMATMPHVCGEGMPDTPSNGKQEVEGSELDGSTRASHRSRK